jgi:fructokinase
MSQKRQIVVVGDGIVDVVTRGGQEPTRHPGGAALNVAKGVAILGHASTLIFNSADDELGKELCDHLVAHGVTPHGLPTSAPTGVANAYFETPESEPVYSFNDAIVERHYDFTAASGSLIAGAAGVALTSFPLDDESSVDGYLRQLSGSGAFSAVDPNPRPALLARRERYRDGFERVSASSRLVKLSDEDIALLYGPSEGPAAVERLVRSGVVVVVTHGAEGATAYLPGSDSITVAPSRVSEPIVDTLGAGDATLAVLVDAMSATPTSIDPAQWREALGRAMDVAAWTCRSSGGTLRVPPATRE